MSNPLKAAVWARVEHELTIRQYAYLACIVGCFISLVLTIVLSTFYWIAVLAFIVIGILMDHAVSAKVKQLKDMADENVKW